VKEHKVEIKNTVKETTKKVVAVVCEDKHGKHLNECHNTVKKAVKKHFKKIQKSTKKVLNTCGCDVKASHHCSDSATATQTVVDCKSSYVKVCSNDCIKRSTVVDVKTEKFASDICGKQNYACAKKVEHHTDKAVEKVNKNIVKVHVVKKVGVTVKQVKKAIKQNKVVVTGKKVVVNKTDVEHKDTPKKVVVEHDTTKKVLVDKIVQKENKVHKQIKQAIKHHASKCVCAESETAAEKAKCRSECESRSVDLKKKVTEHVNKESDCQRKAVIACGEENSKECVRCQKTFILLCVTEETKRRNQLVSLLDECDSFLLEPSVSSHSTIVFQP